MKIEIKTTSEIERSYADKIKDANCMKGIAERDGYSEAKWINFDDLQGYLEDINEWQSPALIHVKTLIDKLDLDSQYQAKEPKE